MKLTYRLSGLDCAHCAQLIERSVSRLPDVRSAAVNFMFGKLSVEYAGSDVDAFTAVLCAAVKRCEPDVGVTRA